ncbi:TerD family protein [Calidifontibacter indicus]|uniref:Tellurium resistance protein TerD n=1 Tax=Calidifontibacter indicus TaxID=419650 RepID=A0A3D9URU1_9MICO|nr:TerD family protein [Calidifontibacter indicus]REF32059.1 tellurium resistance protein TerD [Calidifontibacter indicus]
MSIALSKGSAISLSKEAPGLRSVSAGLGWDPRATTGYEFDLDASLLGLGTNGRAYSDQWFVFYGNLSSPDGSVQHTGDERSGAAEGDDETINVDLAALPPEIDRLVFVASIHEAQARGQNFGQVQNAYIRMVDNESGRELARYDLTEDYSTETALIFGELARNGSDWQFRATGQGTSGGLAQVITSFGLQVG